MFAKNQHISFGNAGAIACVGAVALFSGPAYAFEVPSGQPLELQEVLIDSVGAENWLRFRFVAEGISREDDYEATAGDMMHLCVNMALPYIAEYELQGDVIVVSMADQPTEFGVADPEVTQFFEAFRIAEGTCIWEGL